MQVILREDVPNLGRSGEVVTVKPGYGRNYLLPRGLAVIATPKNMARLEHEKRVIEQRNQKLLRDAQAIKDRLEQLSINIPRAVGQGEKLYGSVTSRDIADALREAGVPIDHRAIRLEEPLKTLGMFPVEVRLGRGVVATLKVWVVAQENA